MQVDNTFRACGSTLKTRTPQKRDIFSGREAARPVPGTMAVLCERPPELLTPPNVIITQNKNHNHNSINNNGHSMRVRLVEVGGRVE